MAFSSTALLIFAFLLAFLGFSASQAPMSMPPMSMASPPTATIVPAMAPVGPPVTSPTSGTSMSPPIPASPEPGMGPMAASTPASMGPGSSPSPMPVLATPSTPDSGASVQGCSIAILAFLGGGLALLA